MALLTNGTLFYQPNLIAEVLALDVILPSLDAATDMVFKKINRPGKSLTVEKMLSGLLALRQAYRGKIWLEVFVVPGLNDTDAEISQLHWTISQIKPDLVQLNTLDRPGVLDWVKPATREELEKIAKQLEWNCEIVAKFKNREKIKSYRGDIESRILQTIKRRPCTAEDLAESLGLNLLEVNKYIDSLITRNIVETERLKRGWFFKLKQEVKSAS